MNIQPATSEPEGPRRAETTRVPSPDAFRPERGARRRRTGGIPVPLPLVFRVVLAAVFLWAGVAKLRGAHLFATDIAAFRLLPGGAPGLALTAAYYLPWLEIVSALGLWIPRWRTAALVVGSALLAGFTVALSLAWARGIHLDCGCFGAGGGTNLPLAIGRNLLLLGVCAALWRGNRSHTAEGG